MMTLSVVSRSRRGRAFVAMMVMAACSDGPTSPLTAGVGARGLSVGEETTCALDTGGALYCWGLNSTRFEYGTAPTERASSPTPVKMTLPPTAGTSPATLASLSIGPSQHTCGITPDNLAFCWGRAGLGELGDGNVGLSGNSYTRVLGSFWSSISVGRITTCGITTLGTGLCWGFNQRGEVGTAAVAIGASTPSPTPVSVGDNVKFKRVVAGWLHACGITTSDTVLCWGDNRSGQLGIGGIDAAEVPATEHRVPAPISSDEKFADLSLGATQTCGITLDHRAFCWGTNATGQLGDGTTTSRGTPTLVAGGLKFVAIAVSSGFAGGTNAIPPATGTQGSVGHTCALTESGAPYCWGWNGDGQLGDGTTIERHAPVAVQGALTLTTIAAGGASTCGMRQRAVWCWGANRSGQLGNGTLASSERPVAVGAPFATP